MSAIVRVLPLLLFALGCLPPRTVVHGGVEMSVEEAAFAQFEEARKKEGAGDYQEAATRYEEIAYRFPRASVATEALYRAGRSWEAIGEKMRARAAYERLIEKAPNSRFAVQARERLAGLGDADLERAIAAYEELPEERRYAEARRLAREAEEAGSGSAALHWRKEAALAARNAAERETALEELRALVERLSPMEVERLARSEPRDSVAAPLLRYRLAMVHHERRDWKRLESALKDFLADHPDHPLALEARDLLEKIARRGEVDPLVVGVVLPLSGSYEAYGQQLLRGLQYALAGSQIRLVIRDDHGDPVRAEEEVERLLYEERAVAVVGGVLHDEAQAVAAKADELGLPAISFSPTVTWVDESEWVFRAMLTNEAVAEALADYVVVEKGLGAVAILHPDMPYGHEMRSLFEQAVMERGGEVRKVEVYPPDSTSFSEPVKKLVGRFEVEKHPEYHQRLAEIRAKRLDARRQRNAIEKMRQSLTPLIDFDAIFLPDHWRNVSLVAPALAFEDVVTAWCDDWEIEKARRTTGHRVRPVMLVGGNLWNHPELPVRGGKYLNCSVFVDGFFAASSRPATVEFVGAFQQRFGKAPTLLEAYAAAAGTALRQVIERQAPQSRRQLRDTMADYQGEGPMGPMWMNEKGEIRHELYRLSIDKGSIREGEPGVDAEPEEDALP